MRLHEEIGRLSTSILLSRLDGWLWKNSGSSMKIKFEVKRANLLQRLLVFLS